MEPVIIENLQVWPEDLGNMNWYNATEAAKALGEGWRLPTKEEFENILYPNKTKIPELTKGYYWSSTKYNMFYVWHFDFNYGYANHYLNKNNLFYVRAVKDFTADEVLRYLLKEF